MDIFNKKSVTQLTYDTDGNRNNSYVSIVSDKNGRFIAFYQKDLNSGRISDSRTTFVDSTFTIDVEAGNGTINGNSVNWSVAQLTAPADTFALVYVDSSGTVKCEEFPDMSTTKNAILLAFVNVGASEITRLEEIEKSGKYIYVRYQKFIGTQYVWDDKEYIVNVGEQPRALYIEATDKIIMSYVKNDIGYVRAFSLDNELTWEYLSSYRIENDVIRFNDDAESSARFFSSVTGSITEIVNDTSEIYTFAYYMIGYAISIDDAGVIHHHLHLPYMEALTYTSLSITDIYLEVYYKNGNSYVLEDEFYIPDSKNNFLGSLENWVTWTGTFGKKYLKIKFTHAYRTKRIPKNSYHTEYFIGDQQQDIYTVESGTEISDHLADYVKSFQFAASKSEAGVVISYEEKKENAYIYPPFIVNSSKTDLGIYQYEESKELGEQYPPFHAAVSKSKINIVSS